MAATDSTDAKSYKFTHIIAIDFGTSGCGIAVWNVASPSIENIHIFSSWFKKTPGVSYKCPTILLLDHEENVEAFGSEAIHKYHSKRVAHPNKINDYYLFSRFKTDLYNKVSAVVSVVCAAIFTGKMVAELGVITRGCHTHSFCTTICDRDRNESQLSNRNIHHSQRSSHFISLIFSINLVKVKGNVRAKT